MVDNEAFQTEGGKKSTSQQPPPDILTVESKYLNNFKATAAVK